MKALAALRAHNAEGALALARAAIEANDWDLARAQMKAALRLEPTQRAFLMMADLEERQHGDRGRVREWLARATIIGSVAVTILLWVIGYAVR